MQHEDPAARIAIATGEARLEDGRYRSPALDESQRLCRAASTGSIVLSPATERLVPNDVRALVGRPSKSLRERGVTRREAEVLDALCEHLTNAEIASRLYVSLRTVESHVSTLLRKLDAANRRELIAMAAELGDRAVLARPALPAPLELLADRRSHVGRDVELAHLSELWHQAATGQVRVVVVAGEAGIGKSRLVAELATGVHDGGGRVVLGSCFADAAGPYEPFAQLLADDAHTVTEQPVLAPLFGGADTGDATGGGLEVADALRRYLTAMAAATPTMVVIEDLHWATTATRDAVRHIARTAGHAPLLLVVITRDAAPDLDDELETFLGELARVPAVEILALRGLDRPSVAALLADLGEDLDVDAAPRRRAATRCSCVSWHTRAA